MALPIQAFITDAAGNPINGAKIYTYEAGTLSPKAVFTTSALTVAHPNPIIATNGKATYFLGAGSYRVRVTDASDVDLAPYALDNISADIPLGSASTVEVDAETQTVAAGQDVVTLTSITYLPGTGALEAVTEDGLTLTVQNGDIIETGASSLRLARPLPAATRITFYSSRVLTSGVSGGQVSVKPSPATAVARSANSRASDAILVTDFPGVVGDGVNDDRAGLLLAIASGRALDWGDRTYRITDTITVTTPQVWRFNGASIRLDRAGTFVKPALVFGLGSEGSDIDGLKVDHNAVGIAQPTLGNQVAFAWCSAVVVMADDVEISDYEVVNSWDNGISVGLFSLTGTGASGSPLSATQTTGKPERVSLLGGRSKNCGVGEHNAFGELGKKGAGVNVLTGSRVLVAGHIDTGSYNGVIVDFAGGAQATVVDCICNLTKRDTTNPSNGSGIAYYFADGPVNATNLKSYFAERYGFVIAGEIDSMTGSDLYAYAAQEEGFIISGSSVNLANITADSCSQAGSNLFDAVKIDSAEGAISGVSILNLRTRGSLHRWGLNLTGPNSIDVGVSFSRLQGATGTFNANPASNHFLAVLGHNLNRWGVGCVDPGFEFEVVGETASHIANVVGDSTGNGTFVVSDRANRNRRLAMGYDVTNTASVVQSVEAGVAVRPLLLNPSGGDVQATTGTWNTGCLRLGAFRLWVDSTGDLRIKNGAPVSDTDGTVVGTQT